jgi:hypothetical protein
MIKRAKQAVATGDTTGERGSDSVDSPYNVSMDQVPSEWLDAQHESPIAGLDNSPLPQSARFTEMPTGRESMFIPNIAAIGASLVTGVAWFLSESQAIYGGPWIAVAVGAIIAAAIRATRMGEGPYKSMLALSAYLITVLFVLIFVTHRDLTVVYGSNYDIRVYEDTLIRTRFQNLSHLLAYGLGAAVSVVVAFGGGKRR